MATYVKDWDKELMSQEDYDKLLGFKQDYKNAADSTGKQQANANAEALRNQYGYYRGSDGAGFGLLNQQPGVSENTGINLLKAQNSNPTGQSDFYKQWTDLVGRYNSRDPFSYDLASDGLYQQYAEQYTRLGDQAMQDTLGQAAALTGGYNSSYAQNAGQQAYQGYLDQLNDIVPELYEQARGLYDQEGADLLQRAQLAAQGYSQETADYWNNLNFWAGRADQEQNLAQSRYGNLVTAITNTGYNPSDAEISAAGMSREEADAWRNYWALQNGTALSGGSSGGSGGSGGGSGRSSGGASGSSSSSSGAGTTDAAMAAAAEIAGSFSGYRTLDGSELSSKLSSYSSADRAKIMAYLRKYHNFFYSWEYDINNVGHDVYNKG